ncbi:hypothetical protein CBA19CS22_36870 [Caballeronia novacaledonica]|uniref:Uncharacterized protein n=1 Tax=Caballeronia novacaledonica TaxID=1544861 RepID=A0ACB5R595_9BURK|nr:hypothetical protein CBA19CS22_36870 [Caballeronia novacaledonica]
MKKMTSAPAGAVESITLTFDRLDDGAYCVSLDAKVHQPSSPPKTLCLSGTLARVLAAFEGLVTSIDGNADVFLTYRFEDAEHSELARAVDTIMDRSGLYRHATDAELRDAEL